MKRRFTPVLLTAVQAQLFHNRQQHDRESVDHFAQELQKLYVVTGGFVSACDGNHVSTVEL